MTALSAEENTNYTGYGINHTLSATMSLDIDNAQATRELFKQHFNDNGEVFDEILTDSFRIKSPKPNRDVSNN